MKQAGIVTSSLMKENDEGQSLSGERARKEGGRRNFAADSLSCGDKFGVIHSAVRSNRMRVTKTSLGIYCWCAWA